MAAGKGKVIRNITIIICTCNIYTQPTGLLGYTMEIWLFSFSTVQLRKQLMVWSLYFWFGALMIKVTALSTVPESIAHITTVGGCVGGRARKYLCRWFTTLVSSFLPHGTNLTCVNDGWEARQVDQQRSKTLLSLPVKLVAGSDQKAGGEGRIILLVIYFLYFWDCGRS